MTVPDVVRADDTGVRIMLRPIATPLSLGFLALAVGTFVLSGIELQWVPKSELSSVGLVLVCFVAPLQLLASVFGFLARDAVAGTGVGVLGATWLTSGIVLVTGPTKPTSPALGLLLVASAVVLLVPATVGVASKLLASVVMLLAASRFFVTGMYELTGVHAVKTAGAVIGLVLAAVAIYAGLAFELESARRRTVLPTLRRGRGADAMRASMLEQIASVQHEAGVREQL